jgi:hypothetical protein
MGGQPGNRQDNRQRGNAAQLLEKYKSMARDMQLAGDRVQTEYYLQFADHYYRVLGESRARFEDQRPRSRDDDDGDDGDEEMLEAADEQQSEQQQRRDFEDRGPRRDRPARGDRPERNERPRRFNRDDRDDRGDDRPARNERNGAEQFEQDEERIAFDVLPPAIGATDSGDMPEVEAGEAPKPRRRATRKPRAEAGDDDVAPAA